MTSIPFTDEELVVTEAMLGIHNLYYLVKNHINMYADNPKKDKIAEHPHKEMCDFLQACKEEPNDGELQEYLFITPRNTQKTTCMEGSVIQSILRDHDAEIIIDSEVYGRALDRISNIRNMFESTRFKKIYGDFSSDRGWTGEELFVSKRTIVSRNPTLSGAGVEKTIVGVHCKEKNNDDVVGADNSKDEAGRAKVKRHLDLDGPVVGTGGKILNTGTIWHDDDANSQSLKRFPPHRIYRRSCYNEDNAVFYPDRVWPEGLWAPNLLTEKFLTSERDRLGIYLFGCNYRNLPVTEENQTIKPEYFQYAVPPAEQTTYRFAVCDPAFSDKANSDYTAIALLSVTADRHIYIENVFRIKTKRQGDILDRFIKLKEDYPNLRKIGIEAVAQSRNIAEDMNNALRLLEKDWRIIPIKTVSGDGSKVDRIKDALQVRYQTGMIFHHPSMKGGSYEENLLRLGATQHDDEADSVALAFKEKDFLYYPARTAAAKDGKEEKTMQDFIAESMIIGNRIKIGGIMNRGSDKFNLGAYNRIHEQRR